MTLLHTVSELRHWRRMATAPVVLVPTMGALHQGHLDLVREARRLAGDSGQVAVSIFVNPLQFGPGEDLDRYPRTLESDVAGCREAGADLVFAPSNSQIYHSDRSIQIIEQSLSKVLCGTSRPGHFDGVCTVVAKLFNLVQPDAAVFGKKDFQQLAIIRRMVRDLDIPVSLHGMETVREADGLAMSSRNRYLTPEERSQAPALRVALEKALAAWHKGITGAIQLRHLVAEHLSTHAPLGRVDYIGLVDASSLEEKAMLPANQHHLIAIAVFFGGARLIDNIELVPK
ncbi:MAG: pantoate--beta-alanine ligase [Verrucomicrobiaceae bacterium]|nr:pantoate--beta-alanine ligase [Verrucomicrobiaceae bacterium]